MAGVDDPPLTEDELKQLRQNLARLSQSGVGYEISIPPSFRRPGCTTAKFWKCAS